MADTDFLALMEQGAAAWNQWRLNHLDVKPDLGAAYLFGRSLNGFNLSEANLERACLIDADLCGANLSKACLQSAYASSANFDNADLSGADLSLCNLAEANFSQATLLGIQANGTNFSQARFTGARLADWQIDAATKLNDLQGSYVYLESKLGSKQRSPEQGKLQPEALADLIRQLPRQSASSPKVSSRTRHLRRNRSQALLVGLGSAAIALLGLITFFRPAKAPSVPPTASLSAEQIASTSLPCQNVEVTTTLLSSNAHQYKDGSVYYGEFVNGQPADGRGTMVYPSGNRYDGEYKDGDRNGCGTFKFSNGRQYIGQFKSDQFSGKGTWILETGERYIGEFKENQCSGKGTFIFFNGSSKSGIWEKGKLLSDDLSCDQGGLNLSLSAYH
ncbi:MAG: pentapeptide repeat-containing protein [Phormidesmis sp.]